MQARLKNRPEVAFEIVQADAARYEFRDDENVIYFYNPFAAEIAEAVLQALERSLERAPRQVWLLYYVCEFRAPFDACPFLELKSEQIFGGCEHLIFTNCAYLPSADAHRGQ